MSAFMISACSGTGGFSLDYRETIPPSSSCSLTLSSIDSLINISFEGIERLPSSFTPASEDSEESGWYVSADLIQEGDLAADLDQYPAYDSITPNLIPEPFTNGSSSIDFAIASDSRLDISDDRVTDLNGMEFHFPLYDGDSVLRAILVSQNSKSCTVRMYDVRERRFVTYFDGVKFVRPIHAAMDNINGYIYVIDSYRIIGDTVQSGGSLIRLNMLDGTGERIRNISNETMFVPRSVSIAGDSVVISDCGNHRILVANRSDLSLKNIISSSTVRFPHAAEVNESGDILFKAYDSMYMTPMTVQSNINGDITRKVYSKSVVGWADLCGRLNQSSLFMADSGRESENGIHIINSSVSTAQKRLSGSKSVISFAVGSLHGDSVAIFQDDYVVGFSPSGEINGRAYIRGSSSGFVYSNDLDRTFSVIVPSSESSLVFEIENDVDSSSFRARACYAVDKVPAVSTSLLYSSLPIFSVGSNVYGYSRDFANMIFERSAYGTVLQIAEDERVGVVLVLSQNNVDIIDSFTGKLYASHTVEGTRMSYCKRKRSLYVMSGNKVTRYTHFVFRSDASTVSSVLPQAATHTFDDDLVDIAAREYDDRLWVTSINKIFLTTPSFAILTVSDQWDNIDFIHALNHISSIYCPHHFDDPYTMKKDESAGVFIETFWGDNKVLAYYFADSSVAIAEIQNHYVYGIDIDGYNSQVYASTEKIGGDPFILGLESTMDDIFLRDSRETYGDVMILDNQVSGMEVSYTLSEAQDDGILASMMASFFIVGEDGSTSIPEYGSSSLSIEDLDFYFPDNGKSHDEKLLDVDSWHFMRTGLVGTKVSVDPSFSFTELQTGRLRRAPVFYWDYKYDRMADTFAVAYDNVIKRFSRGTDGYVDVGSTDMGFRVTGAVAYTDRLAVSGEGRVSLLNFLDMTLVSSVYVYEDITVIRVDNDYIWASSPSRARIYRMPVGDLSQYEFFQTNDAVRLSARNLFENNQVITADSSVKKMTADGVLTTIYNGENYTINDVDTYGDYSAIIARSYDAVPLIDDYSTNSDYYNALSDRRRDNLIVLNMTTGDVIYHREFGASVRGEFSRFNNDGQLFVVRRTVDSGTSKTLNFALVDIVNRETITTSSIEALSGAVGALYLTTLNAVIVALRDGNLVYADSEGYVDKSKPDDKREISSSSSSSSGAASLPVVIPTYIEPAVITAIGNSEEFSWELVYAAGTGSSSSSLGDVEYDTVQVLVGTSSGASDVWNSGAVTTSKKSMLYGGGNNLEPGQKYYVSIRARYNGDWSEYTTESFVMSHFSGYITSSSSSSSSAYSCIPLYTGGSAEITPSENSCVSLLMDGPQTADVIINGIIYVVAVVGGYPVWNIGTANQHVFTAVGDSFLASANGEFFLVTWELGSIILRFSTATSSSSSSSTSSRPYPDIFNGANPSVPDEDIIWLINGRMPSVDYDVIFDGGTPSSSAISEPYPDFFDGGEINPSSSISMMWEIDGRDTGLAVNVFFDGEEVSSSSSESGSNSYSSSSSESYSSSSSG